MRLLVASIFLLTAKLAEAQFLDISKDELCRAEPHLSMCRRKSLAWSSRSLTAGLSPERLEELSKDDEKQGFIPQSNHDDDPFSDIATRAPPTDSEPFHANKRKHYHSLAEYYRAKHREHHENKMRTENSQLWSVYPNLHEKNARYCPDLRGNFAFTCQPSKPLRVDLVEFCKDYAVFCQVPNVHRLPGPKLGPPPDPNGGGRVGVSGKFGFGVGAVPGLEVGVGWGVDVGPIPGIGENVGVGIGPGYYGCQQPGGLPSRPGTRQERQRGVRHKGRGGSEGARRRSGRGKRHWRGKVGNVPAEEPVNMMTSFWLDS